ncbi:unnamed protein product, partial [Owenia fusiformis]
TVGNGNCLFEKLPHQIILLLSSTNNNRLTEHFNMLINNTEFTIEQLTELLRKIIIQYMKDNKNKIMERIGVNKNSFNEMINELQQNYTFDNNLADTIPLTALANIFKVQLTISTDLVNNPIIFITPEDITPFKFENLNGKDDNLSNHSYAEFYRDSIRSISIKTINEWIISQRLQTLSTVNVISYDQIPFIVNATMGERVKASTSSRTVFERSMAGFHVLSHGTIGNGNCLFEALAHEILLLLSSTNNNRLREQFNTLNINTDLSKEDLTALLRKIVIQYMKDNKNKIMESIGVNENSFNEMINEYYSKITLLIMIWRILFPLQWQIFSMYN